MIRKDRTFTEPIPINSKYYLSIKKERATRAMISLRKTSEDHPCGASDCSCKCHKYKKFCCKDCYGNHTK